jgi:hypothetical protein
LRSQSVDDLASHVLHAEMIIVRHDATPVNPESNGAIGR